MVSLSTTNNPEDSLDHWLNEDGSGERILAVEYDYCQYYLPGSPMIRLLALFCQSGDQVYFTVMDSSVVLREACIPLAENLKAFRTFAQNNRLPVYLLDAPLRLETVSIAKPWGQEVWFTGIEERGVSRVTDGTNSAPLPWVLSVAPKKLAANRERKINLLKILDPLPEDVYGDLYFELHQQKREVYVVTHIDQRAWPDGVGAIRYGFSEEVRSSYPDDETFKADYLKAVMCYEGVRREIDEILDKHRQSAGLALDTPVSAKVLKSWMALLPKALREKEAELRERMHGFTALKPLRLGDVVKVPLLMPHSLQHGVRTVEFQTPVYERKILSFAQKVLTQAHWDTAEAVDLMSLDIDEPEELVPLETSAKHCLEEVVRFDDFAVFRLTLQGSARYEFEPLDSYGLLMSVDGEVECNEVKLTEESAVFLPADCTPACVTNLSTDRAVVLLATPL